MSSPLIEKSAEYLKILCSEIADRSVGTQGNSDATKFFESNISSFGWNIDRTEMDVMDWEEGSAQLKRGEENFVVFASPYSNGITTEGQLVAVSSIEELQAINVSGNILLLHGEIASEQLIPKNFVFFNPEAHKRIVALLEEKKPSAIITATTRNSALAGGKYPFPLIEDGDFDIPSVYMTAEEGERLQEAVFSSIKLESHCHRIPAKAFNIIGKKGIKNNSSRIVITAHIDAKKDTPGAIDNATGVIILLLLADLLRDYNGDKNLELVALNGEDYYAVPGQMDYINKNFGKFDNILLNINIDGAGYLEGDSAVSLFDVPQIIEDQIREMFIRFPGLVEGTQWPQGDHSIFIQQGCPAVAVSSHWFINHMDTQDITHTPKDDPKIVDCQKLVEIAEGLNWLVRGI